jgi:hypothetical protein
MKDYQHICKIKLSAGKSQAVIIFDDSGNKQIND